MTRTLTRYGISAEDEDDLRFYFERPDPPEDWAGKAKWNRVDGFFRVRDEEIRGFERVSELEGQLRQFYARGLLSWAQGTDAARGEHQALHPAEPPPPNYQPGSIGSAPYEAWVKREKAKPTLNQWLTDLFQREGKGTDTPKDRMVIDAIRAEVAPKLEGLVRRFNERKAWLERKAEREARAKRRQGDDPARRPPKPDGDDD